MRWSWLLVGMAACGGAALDEPGVEGPTWDDVAPIFEESCTGCHQDGGIAPFALATWADAQPYAASIAASVGERTMPPWLVTDDGTCGDYRESRWLSDEAVDTIVGWVEAGAPAGASDAPLQPAEPPTLDRRDLTFDLPEIVPEAEGDLFAPNDEYRCFLFQDFTDVDVFLTGYEVVPGNGAIVHHVLGMPVDPAASTWGGATATNAEEIARLEAEDERPGWDCLGTVGGYALEKSIPLSWAPGQGAVAYPEGLGVRMRPSDWFVVQVHYNLADPDTVGESDATTVHLRVDDEVEREAYVGLPDPFLLSIYDFPNVDTLPPGESAVDYEWELSGEDVLWFSYVPNPPAHDRFQLWGVMPHMHDLGRAQRMEIVRDGGEAECGFDVPRWDFEWQLIYFYEEPIEIAADDALRVTCTYDTTGAADPVWPGWGTGNEMCLVGVIVTVD